MHEMSVAELVPRLLDDLQKHGSAEVCCDLMNEFPSKLELKYGAFGVLRKENCRESSENICIFKISKKSRMTKFQIRKIVILAVRDVVHFEFISHGQAVNRAYYVEVLMRLCKDLLPHWDSPSRRRSVSPSPVYQALHGKVSIVGV